MPTACWNFCAATPADDRTHTDSRGSQGIRERVLQLDSARCENAAEVAISAIASIRWCERRSPRSARSGVGFDVVLADGGSRGHSASTRADSARSRSRASSTESGADNRIQHGCRPVRAQINRANRRVVNDRFADDAHAGGHYSRNRTMKRREHAGRRLRVPVRRCHRVDALHETLRRVSAAVSRPGDPRARKRARKHVELDHEP